MYRSAAFGTGLRDLVRPPGVAEARRVVAVDAGTEALEEAPDQLARRGALRRLERAEHAVPIFNHFSEHADGEHRW